MIEPRRTVKTLKAYVPPLEGRRSRIRLDFNENTVGFPEAYGDEPAPLFTAYPEYQALLEKLADAYQLSPDRFLLTNGSDEALFLAAFTFIEPGQDKALTVMPTFSLIPHYLKLVGSDLLEIPYTEDFQYDQLALEGALERGIKLAIFASPDNPTGATLPEATLRRWCARFPETLFVIDEAYAEFADTSALPLTHDFENLIVTRTFSKAWGMAGFRLGMMIAAPRLIDYLKRVRSPYSVNAGAVQTASRLLERMPDVQQQARHTMQRKAWVLETLRQQGYRLVSGEANFFMMAIGLDSGGFCEFFRQQGILLRDQSSRPMLQGMVRVSIGSQPEMERFLDVLDAYRQKRVVLFDMDGTLVDTSRSFDATVAHLVKQYSGQPLPGAELAALRAEGGFNDDWEATVELLRRRGISKTYDAIATEAQALYLTLAPQTEVWLVEPSRLARLKQRYRLGVATGRCRMEFDPIWKDRFEPLFEAVLCQDDQTGCAKKPSPELLQAALSLLGAEGGLYVGNSVDDMRAARAAGLIAVGVTTTHDTATLRQAGANLVLDSLQELEGWLMP